MNLRMKIIYLMRDIFLTLYLFGPITCSIPKNTIHSVRVDSREESRVKPIQA